MWDDRDKAHGLRLGKEEEFPHGKGGWTLEGVAVPIPGGVQSLDVTLRALGWGQGGDWAQVGLDGPEGLFQPE